MFFKDVIGHEETKQRLIHDVREGRVPHAQLFSGSEGVGKFAMAMAYARYLSCSHPTDNDACGTCPNCIKFSKFIHPDLHFAFPIVNKRKGGEKGPTSDDFLPEWRALLTRNPYFNLKMWLAEMGAENQQAIISVRESDSIFQKLSLKSSQGGYKIVLIWLPEKMNQEAANKILKLLEEPPQHTVFLLVSENPEQLLPTILSRVQRVVLHGIPQMRLSEFLIQRYGLLEADAHKVAHIANGNLLKAIQCIETDDENKTYLQLFINLMRLAYQRRVRDMKLWSEEVSALGRERQKNFLSYCQHMIRENFIYNFKDGCLTYLNREEEDFASRFSPFVNEKNVAGIMAELANAEVHVEGNVNPKMIFFDFALRMIVLLLSK